MALIDKNVREIFHGTHSGAMLASQHALTRGQYLTIEGLRLRQSALMVNGDGQNSQRFQSLRVIWSPDAALNVERLTKDFFAIGITTLVEKERAQMAHRNQCDGALGAQCTTADLDHLAP